MSATRKRSGAPNPPPTAKRPGSAAAERSASPFSDGSASPDFGEDAASPELSVAFANAVPPELVELVDVLPTIAELAGVALPSNETFDGVSLVPLLSGGSASWVKQAAFSQYPRRVLPKDPAELL